MHSRTFLGHSTLLPTGPTPPIESLEEGHLVRVHSGTVLSDQSVISNGDGSVALFTRGSMGRYSNSKRDLLPLLKSGLASSSLQPAQLRGVLALTTTLLLQLCHNWYSGVTSSCVLTSTHRFRVQVLLLLLLHPVQYSSFLLHRLLRDGHC
jgi:hypothetical protein